MNRSEVSFEIELEALLQQGDYEHLSKRIKELSSTDLSVYHQGILLLFELDLIRRTDRARFSSNFSKTRPKIELLLDECSQPERNTLRVKLVTIQVEIMIRERRLGRH